MGTGAQEQSTKAESHFRKGVSILFNSLFSPITINQMTVKNRLVVPPMVTNYGNEAGEITDRHITYLEQRARGGFGLITLEATAVLRSGLGFPRQVGLWSDTQIEGLARLVRVVHHHGSKLSVQLYHAGRQTLSAVAGTQVVSASPLPCPSCKEVPVELDENAIRKLVSAFASAAERARDAGADAVEIHGAHGYLLAQFTSAYSNRRVDMYGGSLMGRLRFPLEIIAAVRRGVGADFPVIYRISARERVPGGLTLEETLTIASILKDAGVDAFHVSTGVYGSMPYIIPPFSLPDGLNVEDARAIKEHTGIPVIVAGKIPGPWMAESVVSGGRADLVAIGRPSIVDPDLPRKSASGDYNDIRPCIFCNQGCIGGLNGPEMEMSCLSNPSVGKEHDYSIHKAPVKKKVMVAGGGPAGLEAARVLALKGHSVVLCEEDDRLGGQFRIAALPPEKQPLAKLIRWQTEQCLKVGVTIRTRTKVTRDLVAEMKPDAVVVATGSKHRIPPGITVSEHSTPVMAADVLLGRVSLGQRILVMGGGATGCETADHLLQLGKEVAIIELLDEPAQDLESSQRFFLLKRLRAKGAKILTGAKIREIHEDGVSYEKDGQLHRERGFDGLVAAMGSAPEDSLATELSGMTDVYVIGDARQVRKAIEAIREGWQLALGI